jgi:hypothetical protein
VLLGEPRKRKRPLLPVIEDSSSDELLLKAADRMAAALLKGEIDFARRLAREYAEARGAL